jgi:hypothetical protein
MEWGLYIHPTISHLIQAHNSSRGIYTPVILDGEYISMTNNDLWELLLEIVLPTSNAEWLVVFNSLVRFSQLPQGYLLDITKYDFMYTAIIHYTFLLKKVINFLDWKKGFKYSPQLRSRDGRMGFMELIYSKIPSPLGLKLHHGLSHQQVRECNNIMEYIAYFSQQSQKIQDNSKIAKQLRLQYENNSALTTEIEVNSKNNASSGKYIDPKLHYMNSLTLINSPYSSVEKSELPNRSHDFFMPQNNRFDINADENVHEFDYYDADFDDVAANEISMLNPMYHTNEYADNSIQDLKKDPDQVGNHPTNLHIIDPIKMKSMPCFKALFGTCKDGLSCSYSHDRVILQAAYDKKALELGSSPFARNISSGNMPTSSYRPTGLKNPVPSRNNVAFQSSPFTQAPKTPSRPLREIYEDSIASDPEFSNQVTVLNKNVV